MFVHTFQTGLANNWLKMSLNYFLKYKKTVPGESYSHDSVFVEEMKGHVANLAAGNDNLGTRVCDRLDLLFLKEDV